MSQNTVVARSSNKDGHRDNGEHILIISTLVICLFIMYLMAYEPLAQHSIFSNASSDEKVVGGNFPLRTPTTKSSGVFDQTPIKKMEDRERAMRNMVKMITVLDRTKAMTLDFSTETGDKAKWWNRLYKIKSIFDKDDGRFMPMSFMMIATDRDNNTDFTLAGGVSEMVVESEKDFIDPATSGTSFKVTLMLHDTNWKNNEEGEYAPKDIKYIFSQTEKGMGTSIVQGNDGKPLPIFVNFFGLRLEKEPVSIFDNVIPRFQNEGMGMHVNDSILVSPANKSLASVRFHENKGGALFFILHSMSRLFSDKLFMAMDIPDERDGTFAHKLYPIDEGSVLPIVAHIGDQMVPIKYISVSTNVDDNAIEDQVMVVDIWVKLITDQTLQLTGPRAVRDWKIIDPAHAKESDLVKFIAADNVDLVLLTRMGGAIPQSVPEHGLLYHTMFKNDKYYSGVSYDMDFYNIAQSLAPEKTFSNLSIVRADELQWSEIGDKVSYAQIWACIVFVASLMGFFFKSSSFVSRFLKPVGILFRIMGGFAALVACAVLYMKKTDFADFVHLGMIGTFIPSLIGILLVLSTVSVCGNVPGSLLVVFTLCVLNMGIYYIVGGGKYKYNGAEEGGEKEQDEDVEHQENEQFLFMFMCTNLIISSLCLSQVGNVLWGINPSEERMCFTSPLYENSMSQAVLMVLMAALFFHGARITKIRGPADARLEYATKNLEKAKTLQSMDFFSKEVAFASKKVEEENDIGSKWPVVASSFVLFGFVTLWVTRQSRQNPPPTQETGKTNTHETKRDHHLVFWAKYAMLASLLYVVVSEMVRNINEIMDTDADFCSLKRFAAQETIESGKDVQFWETSSLEKYTSIQLAKNNCMNKNAKPLLSTLATSVLFLTSLTLIGSYKRNTYVNPIYTAFVGLYVILVGVGGAWLTDKERRTAILGYNPVYITNLMAI